jgi:hypothetical protein
LSTAKIEWQVAMSENYSGNSASWPIEQIAAHNATSEIGRKNKVRETFDVAGLFGSPLR